MHDYAHMDTACIRRNTVIDILFYPFTAPSMIPSSKYLCMKG